MDDELRIMYFTALLPVLAKPPPRVHAMINAVTTVLMILIRPPPDPLLDIRRRLFPHADNNWEGADMFARLVGHPYKFHMIAAETPDTFIELCDLVTTYLRQHDMYKNNKLSVHYRLLLLLIWLRSYPTYYVLSVVFEVSYKTIGNIINSMWPILWEIIGPKLERPSVDE